MFKRLFWLVIGAGFGFGLSFWLIRAVREATAKYTPSGAAETISASIRQLGTDLRDAAAEGRAGMKETEDRIRSELTGPSR